MSQEKSIYLFCTEGGSNKEYHAHLRPMEGGWMVQYANGPRGKVCSSKNKLKAIVSYEEANAEYEKLVKSKIKDGYTTDESGVRFTNTEFSDKASGHIAQQPSSVTEEQALALLANDDWYLQEKANGENRPITISSTGEVRGINKLGLFVNIPETWTSQFRRLAGCDFDGEHIGEHLHIFDITKCDGRDLKGYSFMERNAIMERVFQENSQFMPAMKILRACKTTEGKRAALQAIIDTNAEGVVFKHALSSYAGGKGKNTLKFKVLESSTFIVTQKNLKNSVGIGLLDSNGNMVDCGNVTMTDQAEPGDLIEVRYMYFNPGGAFEQPVYLNHRKDITREECTFAQVTRLKPGVEMDEDGNRIEQEVERQRA